MTVRDEFFWLGEINKATLVINSRQGLLPMPIAEEAAKALREVLADGDADPTKRAKTYITFEPLMLKKADPVITLMHAGRSSQDMHATYYSAIMRDNVLRLSSQLSTTMELLNKLAKANEDTIVPNYTNGVAAQPNSYAHYLQGLLAGFKRDSKRLQEFYVRLNLCPMGTTVLNGTSWPLNRDKMAHYLGFAGLVEDAYDASQIKPVDEPIELSAILTSIALHVGTFVQDLSVQYAQPRPWILLQEGGDNTYVSSAMPQKRNPGLMIGVREAASNVIGEAQGSVFRAHNIIPGMIDPKRVPANTKMVADTIKMLQQFDKMVKALRINKERALEEVNNDWTSSQEVADVLMRKYGLPFRVGHHVASQIVSYAKAHNLKPTNFPYDQVKTIYSQVVKKEYPSAGPVCPMSEQEFKQTINPKSIIENRRTSGGPQKAELEKAVSRTDAVIEQNKKWTKDQEQKISSALNELNKDFETYLK